MKYLIILSLILSGCSAEWHIKRAVWKNPDLLKQDTLFFSDTIRTFSERTSVDSVFLMSRDTVIIEKNNLKITHWVHNDSVFIQGECDTIFTETIVERKVPVDRWVMPTKDWWDYLPPVWLWILAIVGYAYYRYRTK